MLYNCCLYCRLAEAQSQLANTKDRLADLEKQINDQIQKNEEKEREYKEAEAELARKRKERELELEQEQNKLNQLEADFSKQVHSLLERFLFLCEDCMY